MGSLWHLWSVWPQNQAEKYQLWNHSMLFWGRFGKILEFAGVLTAIVTLVPESPLIKFRVWAGKRLNERFRALADRWQRTPRRIPKIARDSAETTALFHQIRYGGKYQKELARVELGEKISNPDPDTDIGCLAMLIGVAGWFVAGYYGSHWLGQQHLPGWATAIVIVLFWIIAIVALVTGFIFAVVELILDVIKALLALFIFRPITIVLRPGKKPGNGILWIGIILTTIGFHFDLLAS